ncbi:DUF177 domain-containing protein [bacterium]|nr:MAG: DUF177 domain-containing protein [bacterium]
MHINVRDILAQDTGYRRAFTISDENPDLDEVELTEPVDGTVTITKTAAKAVSIDGTINAIIKLECHRCLRPFDHPVRVHIRQTFAQRPTEDEQPIIRDEISLDDIIQQEILLSLPIKLLDRPDCPGLDWSDNATSSNER